MMSASQQNAFFKARMHAPPVPISTVCQHDAAHPPDRTRRRVSGARAYQTGQAAEEQAAAWYRSRGGRILHRRYRNAGGEIDLIVEFEGATVFVEVKARKTWDEAAYSVSARQWSRLEAAANSYILHAQMGANSSFRFDVVLINRFGEVSVLKNAHMH